LLVAINNKAKQISLLVTW